MRVRGEQASWRGGLGRGAGGPAGRCGCAEGRGAEFGVWVGELAGGWGPGTQTGSAGLLRRPRAPTAGCASLSGRPPCVVAAEPSSWASPATPDPCGAWNAHRRADGSQMARGAPPHAVPGRPCPPPGCARRGGTRVSPSYGPRCVSAALRTFLPQQAVEGAELVCGSRLRRPRRSHALQPGHRGLGRAPGAPPGGVSAPGIAGGAPACGGSCGAAGRNPMLTGSTREVAGWSQGGEARRCPLRG